MAFPSPTSTWHNTGYDAISPSRPELSVKGKTIVVTGGGTGIGAAIASAFAEAGASRIGILGRREQPLLDTKALIESKFPNTKVIAVPADFTKKDQVDAAFVKFIGDGKLDVLVSNAAVGGPQPYLTEAADHEVFLEAIQINLRGSTVVAQAFLHHAAKDAVVIDINSAAAHASFPMGFASYSVAKLAVFRLWDTVAYSNPDLRIFHIQPGIVDTDMNKEAGGIEAMGGYEDHVSLPSGFSVWLASHEARFLKGKFLWANWDVNELKAKAEELESSTEFNIGLVGWPWGFVPKKSDSKP